MSHEADVRCRDPAANTFGVHAESRDHADASGAPPAGTSAQEFLMVDKASAGGTITPSISKKLKTFFRKREGSPCSFRPPMLK